MDPVGAEALLRASTAADPGYFPAHFTYLVRLRETGQLARLRHEYGSPAPGAGPHADCLAAIARAEYGYAIGALPELEALEARRGPGLCTAAVRAYWTAHNRDLEEWGRVSRLAPDLAEFPQAHASALADAHRLREAERVLEEAVPGLPHALHRLNVYLALVRVRLAAGDTVRALGLRRALALAIARDGRPGVRAPWLYELSRPVAPGIRPTPGEAARELAALTRAHGDWLWKWKSTFYLANAMVDGDGDVERALPLYDAAVALADSLEIPLLQLQAYLKRGRTRAKAGQLASAERDLRHAVRLGPRAGDAFHLAEAYHNLAHVYEGSGRLREASRVADRFVALTRPLRGTGLRMMSLHDAGVIRGKAGHGAAADAAFAEMVRVVDEQRQNHYWAGEYYERAGDLERALRYYRLALTDFTGETSLALAGRARVFEALGMPDSAEAAARAHDARIGMLLDVPVLPAVLARRGRTAEAVALAQTWAERRVAQGNVQTAAGTLLEVAELLLGAGRPAPALAEALRAESLAVRLNLTDERIGALRLAGTAQVRLGKTGEGIARLERAAALARAHPTAEGVRAAELALGDGLAAVGRDGDALAAYGRAARAVEAVTGRLGADLDRARYRDRHLAPFDGALRLLVRKQGSEERIDALLGWSQRRKGAALALATRAAAGAGRAAPLTLAQAQARLGPREALLDYMAVDTMLAVLVVTRRAARLIRLPESEPRMRARMEALRAPLAGTRAGRLDLARAPYGLRSAHALYRALLAPAEPLLAGIDRLILVPDGALHYMPFEALVTEAPPAPSPRGAAYLTARYVIDRYEVAYLPSAQFLLDVRGREPLLRASGVLLAVAHGAPGADREVEAIQAAWPRGRVRVLRGEAATETAARRAGRGASVVHFAVHARADDRDPLASHLRLGADGGGDGYLHSAEVAEERWTARMVVLSACETLSGRLYAGEGLMGLARAFLASGAESVVATRWPVGPSSADLMGVFYRRLAAGEDAAAALRAGKLALRRDPRTAHPFHWAAFVVVGGA
jgi:CHAT domain-containing protein